MDLQRLECEPNFEAAHACFAQMMREDSYFADAIPLAFILAPGTKVRLLYKMNGDSEVSETIIKSLQALAFLSATWELTPKADDQVEALLTKHLTPLSEELKLEVKLPELDKGFSLWFLPRNLLESETFVSAALRVLKKNNLRPFWQVGSDQPLDWQMIECWRPHTEDTWQSLEDCLPLIRQEALAIIAFWQ